MHLSDLSPIALPPDPRLPLEVFIGPGARARLPALVGRYAGARPFCFADPDTWAASGLTGEVWSLPRHPHADTSTVARVVEAAQGATGVLAVGSGTINDLGKCVADQLGVGFVVLGTAASMNGYASAIAAILDDGLKTTGPAAPARAVVLDTEVLAAAPAALTQAGLGDLLSKPVSDTDWWLADQLEGTGYATLPGAVVDDAVRRASERAAGLATGEPAAYVALAEALVLSGVAMVVAGSSAPASGGEHLLSHLWDMEALADGRETRLHGAQVGVASIITAALYQALLRLETPRFTEPPPWAAEAARIRAEHGALAAVILPQAQRKHARAAARVAALRARWPEIRDMMAARGLPTPAEVRAPLAACGAPHTLAGLREPRANAARVLRLARDIRDRLTVLDLAYEVGVLPGGVEAVLDAAGV